MPDPQTRPVASAPWREPTTRITLRWGGHRSRAWGGLALIIAGGVAIAGANVYTPWLAAIGLLAHLTGWCAMPSAGWRRVVALAPSTLAMAMLIAGPQFLWGLVLPFIGWLLVRHRPARSFPTLSFVLAATLLLGRIFTTYSDMLLALGIAFAVMVASAWCARLLHERGTRPLPAL